MHTHHTHTHTHAHTYIQTYTHTHAHAHAHTHTHAFKVISNAADEHFDCQFFQQFRSYNLVLAAINYARV